MHSLLHSKFYDGRVIRLFLFIVGLASLSLESRAAMAPAIASGSAEPRAVVDASSGGIFRADRNFATRLEANSGEIRAVAATSDGGFIVVGRFSTIAGQAHLAVAKYLPNGIVDLGFNSNSGFDGEVEAVAVQADGKIVVAGTFTTFNGTNRAGIARLNADGTLDAGFDPQLGFDDAVQCLAIQADGKIAAGGDFASFNGTPAKGLVRLNGNGSLDSTFSVGAGFGNRDSARPVIRALAVQADGKIIVGGSFSVFSGAPCQDIVRLNPTGTLDAAFNGLGNPGFSATVDGVYSVVIQPDRQIIVGGIFILFDGLARRGIIRLKADGTNDSTFNPRLAADSTQVLSLALQADGRIVVGGDFASFNAVASGSIVRLNPDGSVDTSFNTGSGFGNGGEDASVASLAILTDGRIAAGGRFSTLNNQAAVNVARLTSSGASDALEPGPFRGPAATVAAATVAGGKIVVAGFLAVANGVRRTGIARLNGDGSLDPTFAQTGSGFDADSINRFVVQPDGKIIVIGGFSNYNGVHQGGIARLNTDGSLDASFASAGSGFDTFPFFSLALQPDGKVLLSGFFTQFNGTLRSGIARLNSDGSLDSTFNPGSGLDGPALAMVVQADGKIVAGGAFTSFNGAARRGIVRLNADGSLDTQFDPGAGFNNDEFPGDSGIVEAIAIQPDGKIVAGGDFNTFNGVGRRAIARLNSDGSLDGNFNSGPTFPGSVINVALQPDGRILAGDLFETDTGFARTLTVRLNSDGSLDGTFSVAEASGAGPHPLADGRILLTGPGAIGNGVVQVGFSVVTAEMTGPTFTTQPRSATVAAGGSVTFTAMASGDPAPAYQWYKDAVLLPGRTGTTLSINPVSTADAGSYAVVATNSGGSTSSSAAVLTVTGMNPGGGGGGGGYGGGGAVSPWFLAANLVMAAYAWRRRSSKS